MLYEHRAAWLRARAGARPRVWLLFPDRFRRSLIAKSRRVALRAQREGLPRDHPRKRQTSRKAGTQSHRAFRVRHACIAPADGSLAAEWMLALPSVRVQMRAEESLKAGGVDFAFWALTVAAWRRHAGSPTFPKAKRRRPPRVDVERFAAIHFGDRLHQPAGGRPQAGRPTTGRIAMKNFALKAKRSSPRKTARLPSSTR